MKELLIVGSGGFAREVIWLAQECGRQIKGILCDQQVVGTEIMGVPVVGGQNDGPKFAGCELVVGIGSPAVRKKVVDNLTQNGAVQFATLIHPDVKMSSSVTVGAGTVICAGCILTVDIEVGSHCILNLNSTVGHDCVIGDFVTVAPIVAISGNVTIGNGTEVGTGASIRQGITLGESAMLGMGGVLTKDLPARSIFAGNPAKFLRDIPSE